MAEQKKMPLIDKKVLLEKMEVKGGWTFIRLPEIPKNTQAYFGIRKVYGTIDEHTLDTFSLMPNKGGLMMMAVNAAIRKAIKKQAGDTVHLVLFDSEPAAAEVIPEDFMECLQDEPAAWKAFQAMKKEEQQECIAWVLEITVTEARIQRMADTINHLAAGRTYLGTKKS
ncbi:bacteriocin resistance YdeI/OmpD-like protein [Chitinophaga dinghuensis]|uniref:Bacteriocin resistance YdeI/OmpD-like protein n=1 Tax=Chitinophaga dinghuensis TaxID=1539050 RepID=A0A327VZ08_9BACT|nr:YdeI/OmpD-associated family protein [Chitinophaga dinghuensis]RAJ80044.1 bacteriocin resistance YdeI/OmpD-like protein [Chitinophaga dinghuensis]